MRSLMVTSIGTYLNPHLRPCWQTCMSCGRCDKKGTSACPHPNTCSGRFDPRGQRHAHPDDYCRCKDGILQWVTKQGRATQSRMSGDPFKGNIKHETTTADERDYNQYVNEMREKLNDPDYDPVHYLNGEGAQTWLEEYNAGRKIG